MKNLNIERKSIFFRIKRLMKYNMPGFSMSEIVEDSRFIVWAVLAGVAVMAFIMSAANMKAYHDYKKDMTDYLLTLNQLETPEIDIVNEEGSGFSSEIESMLSKYLQEYLSANELSQFFTEETKNYIASEITDEYIKKLLETVSLNSVQEEQIRKIISEKISQIDYTSLENEMKKLVEEAKQDNDKKLQGLSDKLSLMITAKISEALVDVSKEIKANNAALNAAINELRDSIKADMDSRYDELKLMIDTTNGRISDPESGAYFQYGFDEKSGAAGYYINNTFKPF